VSARYAVWIATSAAAGLFVGLVFGCGSGGRWWLGLLGLAAPPALFLAPQIRAFGGHAIRWLVLTVIGVFASYASTFVAFVAVAGIIGLFTQGYRGGQFLGSFETPMLLVVVPALGGAALGLVQLPALGHASRWRSWIIATMIGSGAVGPVAFFAVLAGTSCVAGIAPMWIVGIAGGLIYGVATAVALGMRLTTPIIQRAG
jgi:hypothetical protein